MDSNQQSLSQQLEGVTGPDQFLRHKFAYQNTKWVVKECLDTDAGRVIIAQHVNFPEAIIATRVRQMKALVKFTMTDLVNINTHVQIFDPKPQAPLVLTFAPDSTTRDVHDVVFFTLRNLQYSGPDLTTLEVRLALNNDLLSDQTDKTLNALVQRLDWICQGQSEAAMDP